jgi:hypothetical protein
MPPWLGFSHTVYQHVAGVLGAFALAAVLSHIVDLDWRGLIAYFVGYWDDYVRPAVKLALDTIVVAPLRWLFSWHFEVPLVIRDYLSVGAIFGLSVLRALHRPGRSWRRKDAVTFLLCLLGWPAYVPMFAWYALRSEEHRVWMLLALLPVAYLVLLLGANYLLPA